MTNMRVFPWKHWLWHLKLPHQQGHTCSPVSRPETFSSSSCSIAADKESSGHPPCANSIVLPPYRGIYEPRFSRTPYRPIIGSFYCLFTVLAGRRFYAVLLDNCIQTGWVAIALHQFDQIALAESGTARDLEYSHRSGKVDVVLHGCTLTEL